MTPRLSLDLPGPVRPDCCQACGDSGGAVGLIRWQEHDDADRPEPILVVLCVPCSDRLIEPHPRLYAALPRYRPWPGCLSICCDCRHREGNRCTHPQAKVNGGPGVILTLPRPDQVHICRRGQGQRSGWATLWRGPVSACQHHIPQGGPS